MRKYFTVEFLVFAFTSLLLLVASAVLVMLIPYHDGLKGILYLPLVLLYVYLSILLPLLMLWVYLKLSTWLGCLDTSNATQELWTGVSYAVRPWLWRKYWESYRCKH